MLSKIALFGLAAMVNGHFVLQIPASLGYDDANEATAPCDTFDYHTRDPLGNWAVGGDSIGILTTHPSVTWEFNVAIVSDTLTWTPLVEPFKQTSGVGDVCFSGIPGFEAWIGKPVVLQLIQRAPDGDLYQCAAIQFVAGGPAAVPADCTTSSGTNYGPIIPAPPPAVSSSSSSAPPPPTTSSSTTPATTTTTSAETTPSSKSSGSVATTTSAAPSSSGYGSTSPTTTSPGSSGYSASATNTITTSASSSHAGNGTSASKTTSINTVTVNGAGVAEYSMTLVAGALGLLAFML